MGDSLVVRLRCLIVDDNSDFLTAAARLLVAEDVEVVGTATSIAAALEEVQALEPDVALVDIKLGEESGFDLADLLAGAGGAPGCPVILISTYAERDFSDPIAASPALGFLSKSRLSGDAIRDLVASGPTAPRGT